jgi:DNA-binding transcriptional regulator YiaG
MRKIFRWWTRRKIGADESLRSEKKLAGELLAKFSLATFTLLLPQFSRDLGVHESAVPAIRGWGESFVRGFWLRRDCAVGIDSRFPPPGAESERVMREMRAFSRQVNAAIVDPEFIVKLRKKLALDQREAAEIFGGVNAFSRYENGMTRPPLALVKLLKVLDRHPELLEEVRVA